MSTEAGDRLRSVRLKAGLSVETVAERVARAPSTVRAHKNGQNSVSPQMAVKYSAALNVTTGYILYGSDPEPSLNDSYIAVPLIGEARAGMWAESFNRYNTSMKINVPTPSLHHRVDLAVICSGDSGEPLYPDGSVVFGSSLLWEISEGRDYIIRRISGRGDNKSEISIRRLTRVDPARASAIFTLLNVNALGSKEVSCIIDDEAHPAEESSRERVEIIGNVGASFRYLVEEPIRRTRMIHMILRAAPFKTAG